MIDMPKFGARALLLVLLTVSATAAATDRFIFASPVGAWVLRVEFPATDGGPPPPPPFTETLTFHALGTVSESNTLLTENSYDPALGQNCGFTAGGLELNCNGSEGTGTWRRAGRNTVSFVVVKLVFDGETNAHVGFLRVRGTLSFDRDTISQEASDSLTEVLIGTDIETAVAVPLGGANARGIRIR